MNVKKILNCISIIMFFAVTAMIGASALFFQNNVSFGEAMERSESFGGAAELFVKENFPMQENWRSLYARTSRMMGRRDFEDIYYDGGERLIRVFSEYDSERAAQNAELVNEFHEKYKKIPSYIMLVPTASGIYRGDLPDSANAVDQQALIDDMYYAVDEDVMPLDVYNALYSARDNYIYFRTDPYWTQSGAYEAYFAVISRLGFSPYTLSNYDVDYTHVSFYGELSRESGISTLPADTINAYRCKYGSYVKSTRILRDRQTYTKTSVYSNSGLSGDNKYAYFLGADSYKCARIETTNEDSPSLLIIGSDYANCFAPFLTPHYSQITIADPESFDEDEGLSDIVDPAEYDQILILYDIETFCESESLDKLTK